MPDLMTEAVRAPSWSFGCNFNAPNIDIDTARKQAGLDWEPIEKPIYNEMGVQLEGFKRLARSDSDWTLSVQKEQSYHTITLAKTFELVQELMRGGAQLSAADSVNGGRKVWALLKLDQPLIVPGDNSHTFPYFVVINSFDSTGALSVLPMAGRFACWNMMPMTIANAKDTGLLIRFRHTSRSGERVEAAKMLLSNVEKMVGTWQADMKALMDLKVGEMERKWFITKFLPLPPVEKQNEMTDRAYNNIINNRNVLLWHVDHSPTIEPIKDTAYGLYQAGVEYLDHLRGTKGGSAGLIGRTLLKYDPLKYKAYDLAKEAALA